MANTSDTVTLGAQTSAEDNRTMGHVIELRRLLAKFCKGPYSPEVAEFALILRIGGNMQEFDFEGCERIRRNRRSKYITVDIGWPSRQWKRASDAEIRTYLANAVEKGLLCCLRRLQKDRAAVDIPKLLEDLDNVKQRFLDRPITSKTG